MSEEGPFPELTITESGEAVLDLTKVSPKPLGKKEIRMLETALIIGTLLRPEIITLIRDPVERTTWLDSLATAAGALARNKAGHSVSEIAEELGRSEETIRAHLNKKTKAGRLVSETYEKLVKGELRLITPVIRVPQAEVEELIKSLENEVKEKAKKIEELTRELSEKEELVQRLNKQLTEQMERVRELTEKSESLAKEVEALKEELNKRDSAIQQLKAELESKSKRLEELEAELISLRNEREKYAAALNRIWELIKAIEEIRASLS